jgi:L-iditol 2-dehydrogenase
MGHEAAGEIAQTGARVGDLRVGERVTFDSTIYCGQCFYCVRGEVNLCEDRQVLGVSPGPYRRHGAFAEYVVVPRRIVYRLPDNLSFEHAAMIEAVSVAVHAVSLTPVHPGDTAVVVGSGMIGLLAIQALRHAGCARVIAVDPDPARLQLARQLGAASALDPATGDAVAAIREMTEGRGADVAIECVGAGEPVQTAIACLVTGQLRLQGSCASSGEYPASIELMSKGAIRVDPLIGAVAPLAEGPAWFDRLYRREPNLMKVILKP